MNLSDNLTGSQNIHPYNTNLRTDQNHNMADGELDPNPTVKKRQKRHYNRRPRHHQRQHPLLSQLITQLATATTAAHSFLTQNDLHLLPSQSLTLESQITSAALSLSKLNSLLQKTPKSQTPPPKPPPLPTQSWFQKFLLLSNPPWVESFRMSKPTFDLLLQTLTPSLSCNVNSPIEYVLGCALFRLAHGGTYKAVGRRFGFDSKTACRAFYTVCKAVINQLSHLFELSTDLKRITEGFRNISLPNCCGVLGFTRFGAVIVQGIVDSEGRFLDVSAGWPSGMSPNDILHNTKVYCRVEGTKELFNGALFELENGNLIPQYLLGDSCCEILPWLITPYGVTKVDDNLDCKKSEEAFNAVHGRGMEMVSKAFARVRKCWGILGKKWSEECVEFLPFVVVSSCLLYNFMMKCGEVVSDESEIQEEEGFPAFEGKGNANGERVRDVLAWQLSLVSR